MATQHRRSKVRFDKVFQGIHGALTYIETSDQHNHDRGEKSFASIQAGKGDTFLIGISWQQSTGHEYFFYPKRTAWNSTTQSADQQCTAIMLNDNHAVRDIAATAIGVSGYVFWIAGDCGNSTGGPQTWTELSFCKFCYCKNNWSAMKCQTGLITSNAKWECWYSQLEDYAFQMRNKLWCLYR